VEAFATDHVVPSLGYHLMRAKEHLLPELAGASSAELVELKGRGRRITTREEEIWLSYCGDTGPGVFDIEPRILESKVLLIECTFLPPRPRERSAELGHLHLDDLVERASDLTGQAVLLHHLSRRHRASQLAAAVAVRAPELAKRISIFDPDRGWLAAAPAEGGS
jgi:ribonuclease Z